MIAVDTSVLALALNRFAPEHARASRLVEGLVNGDRPWALPWPALHELLVRVTHRHSVARPLPPRDAAGFVDLLLASPTVAALGPTPRHMAVLQEVLGALGDPTVVPPGLELAVVLREHGVRELLTTDSGMRRYPHLIVTDPLRGEIWSAERAPTRRYRRLRPARTERGEGA